ncbi:MAG: molybdopterin-dependent oxidoreductase, partial [Rhodococcus sp. (in: high G+C Gram-positive bacteria)]
MAHWGMYRATVADGEVTAVHPFAGDSSPSPVLGNVPGSVRHRSRITGPSVRAGWLENGPGPSDRRGADRYVAVSWDELTELLAAELRRVIERFGNEAIYGGSYGWASAGRFHHAQSQIHRFLNCLGGYTGSVNSYSLGATGVIMPHVLGAHWKMFSRSTSWEVIARHTDLLVAFGGVPVKNTGTNHGGTSDHPTEAALDALRSRGGKIVSISPLRDDIGGAATWLSPRPG